MSVLLYFGAINPTTQNAWTNTQILPSGNWILSKFIINVPIFSATGVGIQAIMLLNFGSINFCQMSLYSTVAGNVYNLIPTATLDLADLTLPVGQSLNWNAYLNAGLTSFYATGTLIGDRYTT